MIEIGARSLRISVPLRPSGSALFVHAGSFVMSGLYLAAYLAGVVAMVVMGFHLIVVLIGALVGLIFALAWIRILIPSAYNLWGWQVVTVEDGHAVVRLQLWRRGYQHTRLVVDKDSTVEVVDDPAACAHIRINGFRPGEGLRSAGFDFGGSGLTHSEAEQIAGRVREAIHLGATPAE